MLQPSPNLQGLSPEAVAESRARHGSNQLYVRPQRRIWHMLKDVGTEPMFLLLVIACTLYFLIGDAAEAWLMVGAVIFVTLIEIVQEFRSEKALSALRQLSQPRVVVIRAGKRQEVPVEDVVVDDLIGNHKGFPAPVKRGLRRVIRFAGAYKHGEVGRCSQAVSKRHPAPRASWHSVRVVFYSRMFFLHVSL